MIWKFVGELLGGDFLWHHFLVFQLVYKNRPTGDSFQSEYTFRTDTSCNNELQICTQKRVLMPTCRCSLLPYQSCTSLSQSWHTSTPAYSSQLSWRRSCRSSRQWWPRITCTKNLLEKTSWKTTINTCNKRRYHHIQHKYEKNVWTCFEHPSCVTHWLALLALCSCG